MKKILITGAYGYIASYVVEQLQVGGHYILGTVHHIERGDLKNFNEIYLADLRDKAGMYAAIEHSEGVIHLAGLLGTTENIRQAEIMNDVNIGGGLNVLNACDNFKIPCVFIGVGNYFENNTYSISKTTAERYAIMYAQNFGTKVNVVRALNAVGARQKYGHIKKIFPTFIMSALKNEDIYVYGGKDNCSLMDMIWAGDVARVLIDVLKRTDKNEIRGQIFEAGSGVGYPVYNLAQRIITLCDSKSKIIEVPMRLGESNRSVVVAKHPYFTDNKPLDDIIIEARDYFKTLL